MHARVQQHGQVAHALGSTRGASVDARRRLGAHSRSLRRLGFDRKRTARRFRPSHPWPVMPSASRRAPNSRRQDLTANRAAVRRAKSFWRRRRPRGPSSREPHRHPSAVCSDFFQRLPIRHDARPTLVPGSSILFALSILCRSSLAAFRRHRCIAYSETRVEKLDAAAALHSFSPSKAPGLLVSELVTHKQF